MRMRESIPCFSDVCIDYRIHFKETGLKDQKPLYQLQAFVNIFGDWPSPDINRIKVEDGLADIQ